MSATNDDRRDGEARKRVWILTRHYPPDVGALSYRLKHLAETLAEDYEVTVLTAQPNRYEKADPAPAIERQDHLTIRRISSVHLIRSRGKIGRLLTELLGALWMSIVGLRHSRQIDIAFASMPPFFYGLPGLALKRLAGRPLVLDVRDLWLDWAEEIGVLRSPFLRIPMRFLERLLIRSADHLTLATEGFREQMVEQFELEPERATVVFNGLDEVLIPKNVQPARVRTEGDALHVLYAGNLGPSQSLVTLLDGMLSSLEKWPALTITIIGDGAQREEISKASHPRLKLLPHTNREELARMCADTDAFLLHLAALHTFRLTVPSKLFEYAAYERPILCGTVGAARDICERHADSYGFESDDPTSFASAVDRLCSGDAPDNAGMPRADKSELLRSSRAADWRRVFSSVS